MRKAKHFNLACERKTLNCNISNCSRLDITVKGILFECEAFFDVYCRLEKENHIPFEDEKAMDEYFAKRMEGSYIDTKVVEIVNGAFAVELALKYLTLKETEAFQETHCLDILYNGIPEPHKSILQSQIFSQAKQNETTLNKNLQAIANAFENWRYFFEKDGIGISNFFNDFVHIVCKYALSYKE